MPVANKNQCGICHLNVTKTSGGVLCKMCNLWHHTACIDFDDGDVAALRDHKSLSYVCSSCLESGTLDNHALRNEVAALNAKFDALIQRDNDQRSSMKQMFADMLGEFKTEMSLCIRDIKSEIVACNKHIQDIESSTNSKFSHMDIQINALYRKMNRTDIVIKGIPGGLENLASVLIKLGVHYKTTIVQSDIRSVRYINNGRAILAKFNSEMLRDTLIAEYFKALKTRPLTIADLIVDPSASVLSNRVFLNDHFPPMTAKLNTICMKLRRDKKISKFRIKNADKPIAILALPDGKELTYDLHECEKLLSRV